MRTPRTSNWSMLAWGLACLSVLVFPVRALGEDDDVEANRRAVESRRKQVENNREFVTWLGLSQQQARQLLPVVEDAAKLYVTYYEERARILPDVLEAFADFAHEDGHNQGFSKDVERRTHQANKKHKEIQERYTEHVIALEQQALQVLSPTQREFASSFAPGGNRHFGQGRGAGRYARAIVRKQRQESSNDPLVTARRELTGILKHRHPRAEQLGRRMLHPSAIPSLCERAVVAPTGAMRDAMHVYEYGTPEYPTKLVDAREAEIKALRTEINNWNLINGLHLGREQIDRIVGVYDSVAHKTVADRKRKNQAIVEVERAVEEIMNPGQRQVLADFNPCLIPPKNLKDPVRVGQASDNNRLVKWLTRARGASEAKREVMIERLLAAHEEHEGPITDAEYNNSWDILEAAVRDAAALSDTDFELNKEDLALAITPPDRVKELKTEVAGIQRQRGKPGVVARFMLKPAFMDQLRLRSRQLAAGPTLVRVDLSKGPQAENCAKGCAVKTRGKNKRKGR